MPLLLNPNPWSRLYHKNAISAPPNSHGIYRASEDPPVPYQQDIHAGEILVSGCEVYSEILFFLQMADWTDGCIR